MAIQKWFNKIDEILSAWDKDYITYEELSAKLAVSPNYARELLKIYAISKGLEYDRKGGRLIIKKESTVH